MKPTPIIELVGKDVNGIVVDIRTVNPDGSLRYSHQVSPIMVTLRKVRIVRKEGYEWLRWEWDGYSCNYSGIRMDASAIESHCLMMPDGCRYPEHESCDCEKCMQSFDPLGGAA